ncbi:very long chain fatty acid elongase 4-like [Bolinopsis microptera]|uniref:very long chain fatty acid elongase 4-like n=1 Tax=Bolinopsis microptera TaxID=2820187 RepID=UPI003079E717
MVVHTPSELAWDYYRQFQNFYSHCLSFADKRVADWPLMSSPMYTIYLCVAYLVFVAVVPQIMAKRKPLESRTALLIYNFAMVALNLYIFVELLTSALKSNYNWVCTPVDYSNDPLALRMAAGLWWYYISKPIEFFDTIMFILRKKTRQVTFLHVYHHVTMPLLWWIGIKWVAGGQSFFGAMVNSSVHVIMYTYYGLAAMGPEMQKHLWWKKHITHYQLIQFVWGMLHCAVSLYVDCPFPSWMQYTCICYAGSFLVLFSNFYIMNYLNKPKKEEQNGKLKSQ